MILIPHASVPSLDTRPSPPFVPARLWQPMQSAHEIEAKHLLQQRSPPLPLGSCAQYTALGLLTTVALMGIVVLAFAPAPTVYLSFAKQSTQLDGSEARGWGMLRARPVLQVPLATTALRSSPGHREGAGAEQPVTAPPKKGVAQMLSRAMTLKVAAAGAFVAGVVAHATTSRASERPQVNMTSVVGDGPQTCTGARDELLIVGAGALGQAVAQQWRAALGPGARVVGETRTTATHDALRALGIVPQVRGSDGGCQYSNVLFCAPPSGNDDYLLDFAAAAARWSGKGQLVFTSSAGVYAEDGGGVVDEASEVAEGNPRIDRLLAVEQECLARGGSVLRLAGLYTADRGPHVYWLRAGEVKGRRDGLINMITYEDAGAACLSLLRHPKIRKEVFLVSDGTPVTREDICKSARKLPAFRAVPMPKFTAEEGQYGGSRGKRYDTSKVRRVLKWKPRYESLDAFMTGSATLETEDRDPANAGGA